MAGPYLQILGIVLGLALLFRLAEWARPAEPGQPPSRWWFNLGYTPFILGFALLLSPLLTPVFGAALNAGGGGLLPALVSADSSLWLQLGFALGYAFVWDLTQYVFHRLQHGVPALWETHRFHHDETALSAVAQARHHPTSTLLAALFHLPVLLLFGAQAPHFVAGFLMFTLWGFVNHANVRIGFGRLTPVIAGPQWHRIHHSIREEHRDRNFAVLFPVIDLLFGTYWRPAKDEFPPTGLREQPMPSIQAATIEPFVGWYRMLRRRPSSA
jgi:sterol desaturase/sphingolipid hydroxylase (fatty acid hydroxylase superfamily)